MIDWANITYDDLDDAQREKVDASRAYMQEQLLALHADYIRADPGNAGKIVEEMIGGGYMADHMAALRWVASLDLPPAA